MEGDQESARYEVGMVMGSGTPVVMVAKYGWLFFHLPEVKQIASDEDIVDTVEQLS